MIIRAFDAEPAGDPEKAALWIDQDMEKSPNTEVREGTPGEKLAFGSLQKTTSLFRGELRPGCLVEILFSPSRLFFGQRYILSRTQNSLRRLRPLREANLLLLISWLAPAYSAMLQFLEDL